MQFKFVVMPTKQRIDAIALKFLSGTCALLKVDHFKAFVNQSRNDGFMLYNACECKEIILCKSSVLLI